MAPNGTPYAISTCNAVGVGSPFTNYYVDNSVGTTVVYDGFTKVLTARAKVTPCQTYHIKLGIADVGDAAYDSGVFLAANSFRSNAIKLDLASKLGTTYDYLIEQCADGKVTAKRAKAYNFPQTIHLSYTGTATRNVDYLNVPDSLVIPAFDTVASFTIAAVQDNVPEGIENVVVNLINPCNLQKMDSISFDIHDYLPITLISDDTLVCGHDATRLEASYDPNFHYTWTDNPAQNSIPNPNSALTFAYPDTTTVYSVMADYAGCPSQKFSFTVTVEPRPIVDIIPKDTTVCLRDSFTIHVNIGPAYFNQYVYNWSPDINLSDKFAKEPKFFSQDVHDFIYVLAVQTPLGCTNRDTVLIRARTPIDLKDVTADTTILYGNSVQLNVDGAAYYFWNPGGTLDNPHVYNPVASPLEPTIYTVIGVSAYGCRDTAQVVVDINYNLGEFIPNAFSPNGDGLNDKFKVFNLRYQKLIEMRVFNRWGEQVFATDNPDNGWDGNYKGVPQDAGTFNYLIRVARPDGQIRTYKGDVILIR